MDLQSLRFCDLILFTTSMFRSTRPSGVCGVQRYHTSKKQLQSTIKHQTVHQFYNIKIQHKMAEITTIKDYTPFLSVRNLRRKPSAIRELQPLFSLPGMVCSNLLFLFFRSWFLISSKQISLGGGMPNPTLFPFEKMQLTLKNGQTLDVGGSDLAEALQYSSSVISLSSLKLTCFSTVYLLLLIC